MRMTVKICFAGILVWTMTALAHLCNNIYWTPGRIIVKPEKTVVRLERSEEFRVFVQNNYPAYLHDVRLTAQASDPSVKVAIAPEVIQEMKAGERTAFTVRLTAQEGVSASKVSLRFGFGTREHGFKPVEEPTNEELRSHIPSRSNYGDNVLAAETLMRRNDPFGARWLKEFASDASVRKDFRSRALRALGKAGGSAEAAFLREFLHTPDGFLKGNALLALGCLKAEVAVFKPYLSERDDFVRHCALAGAALAGDSSVLPQLKEGLNSSDVYVRIACGWALAWHKEPAGLDALHAAFATRDAMQQVMAGDALTHLAAESE